MSLVDDAHKRARAAVLLVTSVLLAAVPVAAGRATGSGLRLLTIAGAFLAVATLLLMMVRRPTLPTLESGDRAAPADRFGAGLLLYLSPVVLLNVVFPLVSPELAAASIGGVRLSMIILASSVTTPWLAQAACLPAYRVLGDLSGEQGMIGVARRFCMHWPALFVRSLPLVVLFGLPLWATTRWSPTAMAAYVGLCVGHLIFVQSLLLANVARSRLAWALAWAAYAGALFALPTVWWLPPLAGAVSQLVLLRHGLRQLSLRPGMSVRVFSVDAIRGLLLGSVLWADKYVLFTTTRGHFDIVVIFMATLPAVIAYNYFFVRLAPHVDDAIAGLHARISDQPLSELDRHSRRLSRIVDHSLINTAALALVLALAAALLIAGLRPGTALVAAALGVASWTFMALTLISYELDYIGEKRIAQRLGAVHLAATMIVFGVLVALPIGPLTLWAYALVGVVDLALVAVAWVRYRRHWARPEFSFFWRHAVTW